MSNIETVPRGKAPTERGEHRQYETHRVAELALLEGFGLSPEDVAAGVPPLKAGF